MSAVGVHQVPFASPGQESKLLSPTPDSPASSPITTPAPAPTPSASLLALRRNCYDPLTLSVIYVPAQNAPFHPALPGNTPPRGSRP